MLSCIYLSSMDDRRKSTSTTTDEDGAEKEKTTHGSPVEALEKPVATGKEAVSSSTAKTEDQLSKGKLTKPTIEAKGSSSSEVEKHIIEPLPHDDKRAQVETVLKAMRAYMLGQKRAPTAAENAYYNQLSTLVPPAEPVAKEVFQVNLPHRVHG